MVNESWGQCIQFKIAHSIGANHHSGLLLIKCIDNRLERLGGRIQVVRIELNGKTSTVITIYGLIPTASDTQVVSIGGDDHQFVFITSHQARQDFGSTIGRMIIDYDNIILEVCFLRQGTLHCIFNGFRTIENGNNNGSLHLEILFVEVNLQIVARIHQCTDFTQMGSAGLFHLYLHLTIGRIHVIKLLDA